MIGILPANSSKNLLCGPNKPRKPQIPKGFRLRFTKRTASGGISKPEPELPISLKRANALLWRTPNVREILLRRPLILALDHHHLEKTKGPDGPILRPRLEELISFSKSLLTDNNLRDTTERILERIAEKGSPWLIQHLRSNGDFLIEESDLYLTIAAALRKERLDPFDLRAGNILHQYGGMFAIHEEASRKKIIPESSRDFIHRQEIRAFIQAMLFAKIIAVKITQILIQETKESPIKDQEAFDRDIFAGALKTNPNLLQLYLGIFACRCFDMAALGLVLKFIAHACNHELLRRDIEELQESLEHRIFPRLVAYLNLTR